jgi:putative SOS response-associated peptidase YedK
MAPINDRLPVILEEADWPGWLGESEGDAMAIARPAAANVLNAWPVRDAVNSVRNDGPELIVGL